MLPGLEREGYARPFLHAIKKALVIRFIHFCAKFEVSKGNQVLRSCKEGNLWSDYQCARILVHVSAQHKQRAACADRTCHLLTGFPALPPLLLVSLQASGKEERVEVEGEGLAVMVGLGS